MSLSREHSHDKTEWVKWPHLEKQWRPQHYESPHRPSKKGDKSRSHSWWWDSHISPKSSKWLQENLAEMDSKVNAMLKIIEEDADSFAKRAEMYYKRRPELVILVEEFYRTYRALVERHTFLTKELRQNIAPALQAQLTGGDPLVKHGSDGFDLASLSSLSFPGALEFEDDSQSQFSAKSSKGHVNEEDGSPPKSRASFDTRELGFQQSASSSEEESLLPQHQNRKLDEFEDANSSVELRKTVQILEDEKIALTAKVGEDEVKLRDLQSEVSSLLSRTKALESEDKLAKDRVSEALKLKQMLEAENLKLSHALITCKEEKTQLIEFRDRNLKEMFSSGKKIQELEEEITLLQQKTAASHAEMKRFEGESQKLQHALATTQDRNQKEATALKETFEKRLEGLHTQIIDLEEENGGLKEQSITRAGKLQEVKQQLIEVDAAKIQLEQELLKSRVVKETLELDNAAMVSRIQELGREVEATQRNKKELLEQMAQKNGQMSKLEKTVGDMLEHRTQLEAKNDEMLSRMLELEAGSKELQKARDYFLVESQRHKSQCKGLEAAQAHLQEQVTSLLDKESCLQEEKIAIEGMLVKANLEVTELHSSIKALSSEKNLLLQKALGKVDASQSEKDQLLLEPVPQTNHFRDLEIALTNLLQEKEMLGKREAKALLSLSELEKLSQAQATELQQTLDDHLALITQRDTSLTHLVKQNDFLEKQGREALQSNSRLDKEISLLKSERVEGSKLIETLRAEAEELKKAKDHAFAKCQQYEDEYKALKAAEEGLKALLSAKVAENSSLQNNKSILDGELTKLCLRMEEFQRNMSALSSEKEALRLEVEKAREQMRISNAKCLQWQAKTEECQAEIQVLRNEVATKTELISKFQDDINSQSMGIRKLEEKLVLSVNEKEKDTRMLAEYEDKACSLEARVLESLAAQTDLNEQVAQKSLGIKSLEAELASMCKEKDALRERFAACSAHAILLQNQLDKCKELENLQHVDLQERADTIRSMGKKLEDLQLSVSKAEECNNVLICEQQKRLDEISSSHRRIQDLEEQVSHLAEDKVILVKEHEEQKGKMQLHLQSNNNTIQSMEAELLKLHKAVSATEEGSSNPSCQQSRSFDADLIMPDRITHIHHRVGSILEERALLVSKASHHKEERDEMESKLQSLERDKDALQDELKKEQQAASEARKNIEKLEGDLSQLRLEITKVENKLSTKAMDLSSAREEACKARRRIDLLEEEAQQHLHTIKNFNVDVKRLGHQLQDAQQETERLKEHLSLSAIKCSDAKKATCQAEQEARKEIANGDLLRHQISDLLAKICKLEQDVTGVQEEKRILSCKIETLQLELDGAQSEKEKLMVQVKDRIVELEDKELEIKSLQDQVKVAESSQLSLAENFSESKKQWSAEQAKVQEEHAQLQATILEGQKNLEVQLESADKLKTQLLLTQQESSRLEELLSQAVSKHTDAERATLDAKEELNKQTKSRELLSSEMAMVLSSLRKLEHDHAGVQDEKQALSGNLESTQLELLRFRGENEDLMSQVKATLLQLQGKDSEITKLNAQLEAAESQTRSLSEVLSSSKISWGFEQERLQEELAQLRATSIEAQKALAIQLDCVSNLKEELTGLYGEQSLLQEDRDLHTKQLAEHLNQIEDIRNRELKKDADLLELSALAQSLKQSLLTRDSENSQLREELSKSAESQGMSEKKLMDEISFLQGEEMKWRNEVTTNSALMAEKVACLRMENAALHEDLSSKLELLLKLEKDVRSLEEERSSLSQALQAMAAEMQEYKNDLEMFKEFVIPSLEERVGELQEEVTDLTTSNERQVAEIVSLSKQLKDATDELLCLYDENATMKIQLTFNVEMLKHMDGVLLAIKAENIQFSDKLGLQEKHLQRQEQLLVEASTEKEDLTNGLLALTEERSGLQAEVQSLVAVLVEVEQLQKELAASRQGNGLGREAESSSYTLKAVGLYSIDKDFLVADDSIKTQVHNIQNMPINAEVSVNSQMLLTKLEHGKTTSSLETQRQDEGLHTSGLKDVSKIDLRAAKEGNGGRFKAAALLIVMLKEEVLYLQEEIQRLQSAMERQGSGSASGRFGARDFMPGPQEDLPSPRKDSTASSSSILTVEEAADMLDDVQRLKEENHFLVQEIESLKSQSLAAWMENNLTENSVKDLQAKMALLQEQNGLLCAEVSSCKEHICRLEGECQSSQEENEHISRKVTSCNAEIDKLGGECHSLQEEITELQQDLKSLMQEKRKSEVAMHTLEDVITSLEQNNRRLHAEKESTSMAMEKLNSTVSCLHDEGSELIALTKTKMMTALEQVKLVVEECTGEVGDEGIVQIMKDIEHVYWSPHGRVNTNALEDEQGNAVESADPSKAQEVVTELEARNILILNELQARADETNILLEFVVFIRKVLIRFLGGEHTLQRDAPLCATERILEGGEVDEHHIKLAERLHQAFMDERLEQELLELKEGRKQLKEELEVRLAEVQRMESELEKFQVLLEQDERSKGERVERGEKKRRSNLRAEENAKELRELLAQQRRQLGRMQEEVMFGEEQQEAAAQNQVSILVSMESAPSMEGWNDEQVNLLSRELESLRGLNRRHSTELRTISQDLQSMGSIIKEAQEQLHLGSPQAVEEEIISMADLRTQKSSIIDLRSANNRVSVDSTQELLSPSLRVVGGDSVGAGRSRSGGGVAQFTLKPRNFGFTWFLLLFSPDRKAVGLARTKSNKPWAALKPVRWSSGGSTASAVERGRRKTAGCWTCVSDTSRLDSFEYK